MVNSNVRVSDERGVSSGYRFTVQASLPMRVYYTDGQHTVFADALSGSNICLKKVSSLTQITGEITSGISAGTPPKVYSNIYADVFINNVSMPSNVVRAPRTDEGLLQWKATWSVEII
ncbi:hypothetical protein [endosymbiont 'TC1' of Trimyema compressum]|uniref:hypothetical protein n=1 Tax=endosymbiont 'TC1' of Trimyema compressum TaxID=243899 RepID=UPI0013923001|nr:hypothetical protein [endosymbiont 'TC1' of Trimyema compressum]